LLFDPMAFIPNRASGFTLNLWAGSYRVPVVL